MKFYFALLTILLGCSSKVSLKNLDKDIIWDENFSQRDVYIEKNFTEKDFTNRKISFDPKSNHERLTLEIASNFSFEKALSTMSTKAIMVEGLYVIQATPYSGQITKEASCLEGLTIKPTKNETRDQISFLFELKATDRLVLGVCQEDQNTYLAQVLFLYCKNSKKLYDIRYYYPKSMRRIKNLIALCR